jgi:hypothetical protein
MCRHTTLSAAEEALWEEVFVLLSRMGAQVNQVRRFGFVLVVIMCLRVNR